MSARRDWAEFILDGPTGATLDRDAAERMRRLGSIYRLTEHEHQVAVRGEWAFSKVFAGRVLDRAGASMLNWDFTLPVVGQVDVKTHETRYDPLPSHWVEVAARQVTLSAPALVFCHWNSRLDVVWVLGWMKKDQFLAGATLLRAGQTVARPSGAFQVKMDCYSLEVRNLQPIGQLKRMTEGIQAGLPGVV